MQPRPLRSGLRREPGVVHLLGVGRRGVQPDADQLGGRGSWHGAGLAQHASGLNTGIQTTIRSVNPGVSLALLYPLPYPVAPGDLFAAFFGCDHTISTCQAKFNNVIHFRGFPFVPPVELSI